MRYLWSIIFLFIGITSFSQSPLGAWERSVKTDMAVEKSIMIITKGYVVTTTMEAESGRFINTRLEKWEILDSNIFHVQLEFDTEYQEAEGGEYDMEILMKPKSMILDDEEWIRIDEGGESKLMGIWKMTSVTLEGKRISLGLDHPRKEIKILSGTRFQWIDYDKYSRTFNASGGGTYSFEDGVYTEYFEFFSNQATWIGDSVTFKFLLKDKLWYHTGVLPDGMIVDEIWTRLN